MKNIKENIIDIYETHIPQEKMKLLIYACGIYYPHEVDDWPEMVEQLWFEDYNFRDENNFKII